MNPEAKAREIVDKVNSEYGCETFVAYGYAYYDDITAAIAQALQAERDKVDRLKAALEDIESGRVYRDSKPGRTPKTRARAALKEVGEMK